MSPPGAFASVVLVIAGLAGCAPRPAATVGSGPAAPATAEGPRPALVEVFPHVRVDVERRVVEFDSRITPLLVDDPRAPLFYLEIAACSPDTREHETLVVTRALPSHVHAALLLIGLEPGSPGRWRVADGRLAAVEPTGDPVAVSFVYAAAAGGTVEVDPRAWIVNARTGRSIAETAPAEGWVFAGSRLVERGGRTVYDADGAGTLLGFTTFGSETLAWSRVISPEADVQPPEWVAKLDATPPPETPVVVRLRPGPGS